MSVSAELGGLTGLEEEEEAQAVRLWFCPRNTSTHPT